MSTSFDYTPINGTHLTRAYVPESGGTDHRLAVVCIAVSGKVMLLYNICMTGSISPNPRQPIPYRANVFVRIANYLKLFYRLLFDQRVSFLLKLIPLGAFLYVLNPLDRLVPVIDDLVILSIGVYLFVELCPPAIVQEHRKAIEGVLEGKWREEQDEGEITEEDIIDAEFHEKQ